MGFADRRFNWFGSAFATFNRGGALFASISLGSVAFLAQCALFYKGQDGWSLIPPLLITTVLAAFTVGRALDKTDAMPLAAGIMVGLLTLGLGVAWCHAEPRFLWFIFIPLVAITAFSIRYAAKPAPTSQAAVATHVKPFRAGVPNNCHELAERAYDPPFYESPSFLQLRQALDPWREGKTVKLGLIGPSGVGKSANLRAIEAKAREHNAELVVLKGTCDQPQAGGMVKPYKPFTEAIAEHFAVNLLAPHGNQMEQIDEALGGIFDRVVPFADILFPPSGQSQTGSKQELFIAIAAMLRRLATQHPVLLVLDDLHWMDPASQELLEFLLRDFPSSNACPLAILLASRGELEFATSVERFQTLTIDPLTAKQLREILVDGLGLDSDLAAEVLSAAGQQRDNLHWLFQIIAHLAQKDVLVQRDDGFAWRDPTAKISEHLPDDFRESVEDLIAEHEEFRSVLECAASVGQEFTVDLISKGVGMSRLELIHVLDRIEEKSGIVIDLRSKDDTFAFRSAFLLEVLRKVRDVHAGGPRDAAMPQRIREYHHRLASALEQTLDESSSALYAVANHYYAAGARHAPKALEYAIKAARAASFQFQHDLARKYVAMAEECAAFTRGTDVDFERELLLIYCHQARVEGKNRVKIAQQGLDYLQQHPDSDFDVCRAVAQACYDAGIDTRDQQHFSACVRVAQDMLPRFSDPVQQAEAYHFWGIGLPRSEADQRHQHLRHARELADQAYHDDEENLEILRLRARIAGSLAEQLSYGSPAERAEARELFVKSIEIKEREDIRDLEGLALAHGGLGRLAFFAEPPDFDTAQKHFAEDLKYAEKIGSVTGQTKMHSLLAACILGEETSAPSYQAALPHYQAAHALAAERVDKLFALAGLLECHGALAQDDAVEQHGAELFELVRTTLDQLPEEQRAADPVSAIPAMCREAVEGALQTCQAHEQSPWHHWLTELLGKNQVTSSP